MAALDAWLCFEDEAGFSMTPPTAQTWARRGHTPVIRVRGRSQRRFSIAALACCKHGERPRLIYRPKRHLDHKRGGRRSFTWTEYRDLLIAAHQQLGAPIVLVWDNLNVHKDRRLRQFIDTHDWITCYFLPAYAPDRNPVEGIWSLLRRSSQVDTAFTDPGHLITPTTSVTLWQVSSICGSTLRTAPGPLAIPWMPDLYQAAESRWRATAMRDRASVAAVIPGHSAPMTTWRTPSEAISARL